MKIWDTFMFNSEFDMLELRLTELEPIPNLTHVAVEANVDHQDHPKPFHLSRNLDRFEQWADRLIVVQAKGLPPKTFDPDPWAREHAQREYVREGLKDADPDDMVLHGDVDEIPSVLAARNVRTNGFVSFEQRGHFFAVDWLYPLPWYGTVAARWKNIRSFGAMRDLRNIVAKVPNGGWHLSWLDDPVEKVNSFCHPEVEKRVRAGLDGGNRFRTEGVHVDGQIMKPVDVDPSWPRWIVEGNAPAHWYRPRVHADVH